MKFELIFKFSIENKAIDLNRNTGFIELVEKRRVAIKCISLFNYQAYVAHLGRENS